MWSFVRPDAKRVFSNALAQETFPRYYLLLHHQVQARYLLAKRMALTNGVSLTRSTENELWEEHRRIQDLFNTQVDEWDRSGEEKVRSVSPNYLDLKVELLKRLTDPCRLCSRECMKERLHGELGFCSVPGEGSIASVFPHMGEESVLVPSGTIFFNGCTFNCVFCQNSDIAQEWSRSSPVKGKGHLSDQLVHHINSLSKQGVRNINYVGGDPTPHLPQILQSWQGTNRNVCQLFNSNHYLSKLCQELIVDIFDFWLPDFKYWDNTFAKKMSNVPNYREVLTRNLLMCAQVGSGEIIVRHLVMPGRVDSDTKPILRWIAEELDNGKVMVNIMGQYRPAYKVQKGLEYEVINRTVSSAEMTEAKEFADSLGLKWRLVS